MTTTSHPTMRLPALLILASLMLPVSAWAQSEGNMNGPPAAVAPPLVPVTAT